MTATNKNVTSAKNFITAMGRLSYLSLLAPKQNKLSKEPKLEYEATIIWGPEQADDIKAVKAWAMQTWIAKHGPDKSKWPMRKPEGWVPGQPLVQALQSPFRACEDRADAEGKLPNGYPAGGVWVRCASKFQPGVVDKYGQKIVHENGIIAGDWGHLEVNCFVWEYGGKHGLSLGLLNVIKMKDGEPLGGRVAAEKVFHSFIQKPPTGGSAAREDVSAENLSADDIL